MRKRRQKKIDKLKALLGIKPGRVRGFEVAKGYESSGINLPKRMTSNAAGYDFECASEVTIQPIWPTVFKVAGELVSGKLSPSDWKKPMKPTLVATGVKAYMDDTEYLMLANRSSNPLKLFLWLANSVGIIDADYYSNEDNDGHIMFQFTNFGFAPVTIKKGDRIGQGIFMPFLLADSDKPGGQRQGGFGHTNK